MEFYSRSNYPKTIPAPECSKFIDTFALEIDKTTGKKELKKSGKTNVYEKIQKSKDATLIYNIIERYQNGDISALEQKQGVYGDFTNLPTTLAEAQQILINAEKTFMSLPLEERQKYNHSVSEFLAEVTKPKPTEQTTTNYEQIIAQQQAEIEKLKTEQQGGNA